jgi:hypothetical protein
VLKKFGEHIHTNAANEVIGLHKSPHSDQQAARIGSRTIEQNHAHRDRRGSTGELAQRIAATEEAVCFSSCLNKARVTPSRRRFPRPRSSRGASAEQARDMNRSRPQTRQFRGPEQSENRTLTQPIRVPRTIDVRAQTAATGAVTNSQHPRTHRGFNSPGTGIGSGHKLSAASNFPSNCPCQRIRHGPEFSVKLDWQRTVRVIRYANQKLMDCGYSNQ